MQGNRDDSTGKISWDSNSFPNGIPALAAYAHKQGVKLGLGTDIGPVTKSGKSGSKGFEKVDPEIYAEWG